MKNNNETKLNFDSIHVNLNDNNLHNLMNDLNICDNNEENSFQDDLLEMIGKDVEC